MPDGEKRGRGRPLKAPEKGKRQNYTFRLHDSTRERLIEAARAANRTLSEEIEYRVEHSFGIEQEVNVLQEMNQSDEQMIDTTHQIMGDLVKVMLESQTKHRQILEILTGQKFEGILGSFKDASSSPTSDDKEPPS